MKKIESLKLSKFKKYELSKESHSAILGGWIGATNRSTGATWDEYNDASKYFNEQHQTYLWTSSDVTAITTPIHN